MKKYKDTDIEKDKPKIGVNKTTMQIRCPGVGRQKL